MIIEGIVDDLLQLKKTLESAPPSKCRPSELDDLERALEGFSRSLGLIKERPRFAGGDDVFVYCGMQPYRNFRIPGRVSRMCPRMSEMYYSVTIYVGEEEIEVHGIREDFLEDRDESE